MRASQDRKSDDFEVKMPTDHFDDSDLLLLAGKAFHTWAFCLAHRRKDPVEIDFAIEIKTGLPSDLIVRHYHPKESSNQYTYQ